MADTELVLCDSLLRVLVFMNPTFQAFPNTRTRYRKLAGQKAVRIPCINTLSPLIKLSSILILPPISGFIGLVVGLGVIFIGSCIGIFLLLRHRPHGGRRTLKKSGRVGEESDFPHRRGTLFGFRSRAPGRDGWMRTGGDEWDSDMEEWNVGGMSPERQGGAGSHRMMDTRRGHARTQGTNAEHAYGNVPKHRASPSSAGLVEPDRVTDSPEPSPDDDNFHDPSALFRDDEHHRNISIDSAATVVSSTTFPGGTKFKEAL